MFTSAIRLQSVLHPIELTGVVTTPAVVGPWFADFPPLLDVEGDDWPKVVPHLPPFATDHLSNLLVLAGIGNLDRQGVLDLTLACARVRRPAGRLLIAIPTAWRLGRGELTRMLESAGLRVLELPNLGGTGHDFLLAKNAPEGFTRGLDPIQSVIVWDAKDATYKLALIRALCWAGRTAPHSVIWLPDRVMVPLRSLAVAWLEF